MTVEKKKLARRGIKVIFYLYIIGIFYFVLLSERYGRNTGYDTSHVNLVLFKEINRFWTYRHLLSTEAVVTNLFGNIFAFSPFGFMIPIVINKKKAFFRAVFATSSFSLVIETSQLIMKVGVFDVDDLLMNTFGGLIGYMIYRVVVAVYDLYNRKRAAK